MSNFGSLASTNSESYRAAKRNGPPTRRAVPLRRLLLQILLDERVPKSADGRAGRRGQAEARGGIRSDRRNLCLLRHDHLAVPVEEVDMNDDRIRASGGAQLEDRARDRRLLRRRSEVCELHL